MDRWIEDVQGKSHPGFGCCIYCGSDGGNDGLRREHIIPKSLGGTAVIQKASCKSCEAITSYVDGYLAKAIFHEYRAHAGAPSRRKKSRPTEYPARIIVNGVEALRIFSTPDHPYFLAMPVWGLPTILTAGQPNTDFPTLKAHIYEFIPENIRETVGLDDMASLQVRATGQINYSAFARAIAKIAYCNAALRYGLNGYRRFPIPELVLGSVAYASHVVGVSLENPPPPAPHGTLHRVDFDIWHNEANDKLIVCSVRLFAHSGTDDHGLPIYLVAIGRSLDSEVRPPVT